MNDRHIFYNFLWMIIILAIKIPKTTLVDRGAPNVAQFRTLLWKIGYK